MSRAFYCIATGTHKADAVNLLTSLRKFDKTTEFIQFSEKDIELTRDPQIFYRAAPYFAKKLMDQGYTELCKLDADQIITGDISDIWDGDYDVATVLNDPTFPIQVFDIVPYYNNGLVVLKSKEFVEHWLRLCYSPHFNHFQYREQDLLNILCSDYHNYKVKCLDGDKIYGEFAKPLWSQATLTDEQIMVKDKALAVIHFGGGNAPNKTNYRIRFAEPVVKRIEELIR